MVEEGCQGPPAWVEQAVYATSAFPGILLAFGLLLAALNVYLRDVQYLTGIVLMLALWAAPIVYGWTMVHEVFTRFG